MPKIREYESGYQASGRGLSETGGQSLNTIQMESRAKQGVIDAAVNTGETIYKRAAQVELSDLNAKFADARAEWQARIDEDVRNGSIDTQKIQKDYQDFAYKINEGISTSEGKSYFEKQSARLNQYILKNAGRGQAQVAGAKAESDWREALNKSGNLLQNDPSNFKDIYDDTMLSIDDQVAVGAIPATIAEKFRTATGQELAKNAVRGMIKKDPGGAKNALNSGAYDEYLDADAKAQLINSADSEINQRNTEFTNTLLLKHKDPWRFLQKTGQTGGLKPIALDGGAGDSFKQRSEFIAEMNQKHGLDLPFMSEMEAEQLSKQILSKNVQEAKQIFFNLDTSVDDKQKTKFGMQIFQKEPALAAAMMIGADSPNDAGKVFEGMKLLRPSGDGKAPIAAPSPERIAQEFDRYVGAAVSDPNARNAARQAIVAHLVKTKFDQGDTSFKEIDSKDFDDSAYAILGPRVNVGGIDTMSFRGKNGKFLDQDDLQDFVNGLTVEDIEKVQGEAPLTDKFEKLNIKKARNRLGLEAVGDGAYYMFLDRNRERLAMSKTGKPFVLDLKKLERETEKKKKQWDYTHYRPGQG